MLLQFPDEQTLALALNSQTVPADVAELCARAGRGDDGSIWIESNSKLARAAQQQLKHWGVEFRRTRRGQPEMMDVRCWPQIISGRLESPLEHVGERTVVLFELPAPDQLPGLVNELLRQGNDRLSFQTLTDSTVLLKVIGPPYYTLLRASEERDRQLRAYVEVAPRVWAPLRYKHPFSAALEPAAGELLFLDPDPSQWRTVPDEPFRDVYELLSLKLPSQPAILSHTDSFPHLEVPLLLARGGQDHAPEIWVLTENAVDQLEQFVRAATDRVVDRLAFAVAERPDKEPVIIVRVRPGRSAPPVLVFDGLGCVPYLRIPNLFVPMGQRIHPPLRRDAVREILAEDDSQLVWLHPAGTSGSYTEFSARMISDSAFLPLSSWVDYVLDQDREILQAWRQSHSFDFEGFVCPSDNTKARRKAAPKQAEPQDDEMPVSEKPQVEAKEQKRRRVRSLKNDLVRKPVEVDEERKRLQAELIKVEQSFLKDEGPLDDPARSESWWTMADLNAALNRWSDSSICHQQLVWQDPNLSADALESWLENEVVAARASQLRCIGDTKGNVAKSDVIRTLGKNAISPSEVNQVVAWICVTGTTAADVIRENLSTILSFLEANERVLSSRACWLAWWTVSRAANDELTLARARDRLLERLFHRGVIPDRDLPAFLRSSLQDGERFRTVRDRVQQLHTQVREWSLVNLGGAVPLTADYVDLVFAWGLARLGESTRASELLQSAQQILIEKPQSKDPVHHWLCSAYQFRIERILDGEPMAGQLSDALLAELDVMDSTNRYRIDTLRRFSTIIEPHERLDQYQQRIAEEGSLEGRLVDLFSIRDGAQLKQQIDVLLAEKRELEHEAVILTRLLELAPRLGEGFGIELVTRAGHVESNVGQPLLRAGLLEKGLLIAVHYGLSDQVQAFYSRMVTLLDELTPSDTEVLKGLSGMLSGSFRSLRRMGMKEELAVLLERLSRLVQVTGALKKADPELLSVMLQVAGSWFHFGMDAGWKQIDSVRTVIFAGRPDAHSEKAKQATLAIAYVEAVSQAPTDEAMDRLQELFDNLRGVEEHAMVKTHYSGKILRIVESVVRCLVSDGLSGDQSSQRWLDETEYVLRQRIHRDMRDAVPT